VSVVTAAKVYVWSLSNAPPTHVLLPWQAGLYGILPHLVVVTRPAVHMAVESVPIAAVSVPVHGSGR
jgi:hypothetical protein